MDFGLTPTATSPLCCAMFIMTFALPTVGTLVSRFIVLIERRATALALNARCAGTRTRRPAR